MTSIDRMSVERLAEYISPDVRRVMLAQADRIEELEAKAMDNFQMYVDANEARIDADAKLAKAVEMLALCRKMQAQVAYPDDPLMVLVDSTLTELKGGEPIDSKELVANVILNRVKHSGYPDTICGVVNQRKQFSYTHDGLSDDPMDYGTYHDRLAWVSSKDMARYVVSNGVINGDVIMFHNTKVDPYWTSSYTLSGAVGGHTFYQEALGNDE